MNRVQLSRVVFAVCLVCGVARAQSPVFVDFVYPGAESGTSLQPYDTLAEGVAGVAVGGTVTVVSNATHETLQITKALTLVAQGGPVQVGVLSSALGSGAPLKWLRIVEIMYNPLGGGAEFLEVQNTGPVALDISGVQFSLGITFAFPAATVLSPGEYRVLVRSTDATLFSSTYPGVPVGGYYTGALDNGGETLQLSTSGGVAFLTLTYNDGGSWPAIADGGGFSLVIRNSQGDPSDPANWRGSADAGGSPGSGESDPNNPVVVISEALTHTDLPQYDSVELVNLSGQTADVRGWFLTDDKKVPQKARIPSTAEFVIPAGGYAVLDELDFAPPPTGAPGSVGATPMPGFRMSSFGEAIYLFSADVNGVLTGYMHGFSFGAAENGASFGRVVTSDNREHFVAQTAVSLGGLNPGPAIGPLVVSEIHYNPVPGGVEYVEITNRSGTPVNLYDDTIGGNPNNTFRIAGIGFAFPPGQSLAASAKALIVNTPPAQYTAQFGAQGMAVYGPFGNYDGADAFALSNADETLKIQWADHADTNPDHNNAIEVPYIAMDTVRYDDASPWPNADHNFMAIRRTTPGNFGGEPTNWTAQPTSHQATGGVVAPVTFSLPRGFYTGTQSLALSTATAGATIYYTTDGSLPAPGFGTSAQYTAPIGISVSQPIRAAAYLSGSIRSPIAAATYLINTPANQRGVKALAIVADPQEDLFLPNGVMAIQGGTYIDSTFHTLRWVPNLPNTALPALDNPLIAGTQTWLNGRGEPVYPSGGAPDPTAYDNALLGGRSVERHASFEMLDPTNATVGQQADAGIRVHGSTFHRPRYALNLSADWTLPQITSILDIIAASYNKFSLRMYFRGDYGTPNLTWDIFPGDSLLNYDKIVLRGGHNDGYNPFIRDELTRRLYIDMGRVSARGEVYNLFINGVYRGYYNATEHHDADFLAARYGASKDWDFLVQSADVVNTPFDPVVQEGDRVAWDALMTAVALDLAVTANYNAVAAMLDIDAFIDYLLVELYSGNDDWPNNNWSAARERVPGAKWVFPLWDAEASYLSANTNKTGLNWFPFWWPAGGTGLKVQNVPLGVLYRKLVANSTFRSAFQARALLHLGVGGALDIVNVTDRYNALKAEMQAVMPVGVTFNDFTGATWIPGREAKLISDLQAEGLYP
jgi:hypothetical protein